MHVGLCYYSILKNWKTRSKNPYKFQVLDERRKIQHNPADPGLRDCLSERHLPLQHSSGVADQVAEGPAGRGRRRRRFRRFQDIAAGAQVIKTWPVFSH